MRFYRLRQLLGILVALSMLLQTSAPIMALSSKRALSIQNTQETIQTDSEELTQVLENNQPQKIVEEVNFDVESPTLHTTESAMLELFPASDIQRIATDAQYPAISDDGRFVVYKDLSNWELMYLDRQEGTVTTVATDSMLDGHTISSDGRYVVYEKMTTSLPSYRIDIF
ncbi:MAG: hypothetical protein M5U34_27020 [Chloroflexi bacterium]|nr:hypothetical protein [Chloroflexota bacterium]